MMIVLAYNLLNKLLEPLIALGCTVSSSTVLNTATFSVTVAGSKHGEFGVEDEDGVKEESGQDEDILTFEEFKQRRMLEVQQHQQEEMKNTGELIVRILSLLMLSN